MQILLEKLCRKEICMYNYINNNIDNVKSKINIKKIIDYINNNIDSLVTELVLNIDNEMNNILSNSNYNNIIQQMQKLFDNKEYIYTYSLKLKFQLFKYIFNNTSYIPVSNLNNIQNKLIPSPLHSQYASPDCNLSEINNEIHELSPLKKTTEHRIDHDKFYTNIHIVKDCINYLTVFYKLTEFDLIIEPSAGSGNFLLNIDHKNVIGLDIEPEHELIKKQDFFTYEPEDTRTYNGSQCNKYLNILTIGNPPFGKICSLAIKFFNHASKFSNVIAFIIPRSFRKISIQNKLDSNFNLIYDIDIPLKADTFIPSINIKCCFQIWIRNTIKRDIIKLDLKHDDWDFLNYKTDNVCDSNFAIRAYGSNCGTICEKDFDNLNPKGWHFIKSNIESRDLINKFKLLNFKNSENTARQNSLGKAELIDLYKQYV